MAEKSGFSLIELSIVLVILGLLTGGILAGQSLIRAAELRAVSTEYNRWITATQTFRDKYSAWPGDMKNAQSYWGVAHATPATCITTASTTALTCNGDGDGQLNPTYNTTAAGSHEMFRYWQHLANAGLIEGSYSGIVEGGGSYGTIPGRNAPASKMSSSGWSALYWGDANGDPYDGSGSWYAMNYGNILMFGGYGAGTFTATPVLKPEEAWNIDTKMDDGKPATGSVVMAYWNNACSTADDGTPTNNDLVASYRLSDSSLRCIVVFRQVF